MPGRMQGDAHAGHGGVAQEFAEVAFDAAVGAGAGFAALAVGHPPFVLSAGDALAVAIDLVHVYYPKSGHVSGLVLGMSIAVCNRKIA